MSKRGFTLIELMVVVFIMMVISSIILWNNSKYSSDTIVTNVTYEIALEIRQAQQYGISVHNIQGETGGNTNPDPTAFNFGYGVDFSGSGAPITSFVLFADNGNSGGVTPNNGTYDSASDSKVDTFNLPQGVKIVDFFYNSGGNKYSYKTGNAGVLTYLDITFKRPKPDALINTSSAKNLGSASIIVSSSLNDKCNEIDISSTGEISIQPNTVSCSL